MEQMASDWYRMASYAWYAQWGVCDAWLRLEMQAGLSHAVSCSEKAKNFRFDSVELEQLPFQLCRWNPRVSKLTLDVCMDIKWSLARQLNCLTKKKKKK